MYKAEVCVRLGSDSELDIIYELMKDLFPKEEMKEKQVIYKLLQKKKYQLYIAENLSIENQNKIIGFSFIYMIEEWKSIWIDYMAIIPACQNGGYGSQLFFNIVNKISAGKHIFMEIEKPEDDDPSSQKNKRLRFYKRYGVELLTVDYLLPTPDGSLPMYLGYKAASAASASINLSKELLSAVIKEVVSTVHADLKSTPMVLEKVLNNLKDNPDL